MTTKNLTIDVTDGFSARKVPRHGIEFGGFNSLNFNLFLQERVAPTPQEKSVSVSVPYRQGSIDMSGILGRRIYENRTITYIFYRFGVEQCDTNVLQTTIENLVMREMSAKLYDTFDPKFYYTGKCREVFVREQYTHKRIEIEMIFDLHPLKRRREKESRASFDDFNFDLDVFHNRMDAGDAEHVVILARANESTTHNIFNSGKHVVPLTAVVNFGGTLTVNGGDALQLLPGDNIVVLKSNGATTTATLDWQKELI